MDYKYFGNTGIKVSEMCLGTQTFGWTANEETSKKILNVAWDAGINFIDTADVYYIWSPSSRGGISEEIIGDWMKKSGNRDDVILATKLRGALTSKELNLEGLSRRWILKAIDGSLSRLQTSWIDLYQPHWPDDNVNIKETLKALTELVSDHKVNYIGASAYKPWQFMEAMWMADKYDYAPFSSIQHYYSIARRHVIEPHYSDIIKKFGIASLTFSPLSEGFLTGRYQKGSEISNPERGGMIKRMYFNDRGFKILETVEEIAKEIDMKPSQVALAWILHQDFITCPILGASTVEQMEENLGALDVNLTDDQYKRLDEVSSVISNRMIP